MRRSWALLSLLLCLLGMGVAPSAQAQAEPEHGAWGHPGDTIVGVDTQVPLPANPADYTREQVGAVTWDYPTQAAGPTRALIDAWRPAWHRIESDLGEALDSRMHIRVARNADEMRALAPPGGPPPAYAAGVTYPALGLVLLTFTAPQGVEPPDIDKVLVHELSHLALHRAVQGHPVPRWFTEGLAIQQANELSFERAKVLMQAAFASQRIPLRELSERFPERAYQVDLAYAQSADIVRFLLDDPRGRAKLRRLVRELRGGAAFADALEAAYYVRPAELEREWVADLSARNRWFPVLVGGGVAWAIAALLLPIAYVRRRRRAKEKLEAMARRETAERAARLRELIETLEARRALWVVPVATVVTGADTDASSGVTVDTVRRDRVRDSDGTLPVVRVGDETHTLH